MDKIHISKLDWNGFINGEFEVRIHWQNRNEFQSICKEHSLEIESYDNYTLNMYLHNSIYGSVLQCLCYKKHLVMLRPPRQEFRTARKTVWVDFKDNIPREEAKT